MINFFILMHLRWGRAKNVNISKTLPLSNELIGDDEDMDDMIWRMQNVCRDKTVSALSLNFPLVLELKGQMQSLFDEYRSFNYK